uniref:Protein twisted gastrulation n=1 Tax=Syphacia muris TaxID=451379 RepID=A0A0N5ASQ6_9BILA
MTCRFIQASLFYSLCLLITGCLSLGSEDCNGAECGSRVSKCMLLGACNCSISRERIRKNNCSCCKDCIKCLNKQFIRCCGCVGLCDTEKKLSTQMTSYVDNLDQDQEALIIFEKVASINEIGTTYAFPAFDQLQNDLIRNLLADNSKVRSIRSDTMCTVLYLDTCISHNQCIRYCLKIGASMLRWFHSGCCECIGQLCLPYGSNIPRCKYCNDYQDSFQRGHEL